MRRQDIRIHIELKLDFDWPDKYFVCYYKKHDEINAEGKALSPSDFAIFPCCSLPISSIHINIPRITRITRILHHIYIIHIIHIYIIYIQIL